MPVLMPWADQAAAVIYAWLPGQAMGEALADVLLGQAEPGGRLPVTLPADEADCPVLHAVPRDGQLGYHEGLLIGYRGYDAAGTTPRFPFGHGLGYTSWVYESLSADLAGLPPGEDLGLRVRVRNAGSRPGREVVQVYVAGPRRGPAAGARARCVRVGGGRARRDGGGGTPGPGPGICRVRRGRRRLDLAARRLHHRGGPVITRPPAIGRRDVGLTSPWFMIAEGPRQTAADLPRSWP